MNQHTELSFWKTLRISRGGCAGDLVQLPVKGQVPAVPALGAQRTRMLSRVERRNHSTQAPRSLPGVSQPDFLLVGMWAVCP